MLVDTQHTKLRWLFLNQISFLLRACVCVLGKIEFRKEGDWLCRKLSFSYFRLFLLAHSGSFFFFFFFISCKTFESFVDFRRRRKNGLDVNMTWNGKDFVVKEEKGDE